MRTNLKIGVIALTLALPLTACNEDDIEVPLNEFATALTVLNLTTPVTGNVTVEIVANVMRVTVTANGLEQTIHAQFINGGHNCPTAANDTNHDGFIDIVEAQAATGLFLLALDSTLTTPSNSVVAGFPSGPTIAFAQTALLSAVENSLRGAPTSPFITNIPVTGDFNPNGLSVLILGTTQQNLPATVATIPGFTAQQTLPVACGVLAQVVNP